MADAISFKVDPDKEFARFVSEIQKEVEDLTIPYVLMTKDWFKGNRAIFTLSGKGKYVDLSPDSGRSKYNYKRQKLRDVGFVYPILKRSGLLEKSLTVEGDASSIAQIINKKILILGTKDRVAAYHQIGTKRLPVRPMIFIGAEQTAPDDLNKRRENWIKILENHYIQVMDRKNKS